MQSTTAIHPLQYPSGAFRDERIIRTTASGKFIPILVKSVHKDVLNNEEVNISLPGFTRLVDKHTSTFQKAFWVLAMLMASSAFFYQLAMRLTHFLYSEPSLRTEYRKIQELEFPTITICPTYAVRNNGTRFWLESDYKAEDEPHNLKMMYRLIDQPDKDITSFWEMLDDYIKGVTTTAVLGRSFVVDEIARPNAFNNVTFLSLVGRCTTIYPEKSIQINGIITKLNVEVWHETDVPDDWVFSWIHPKEDLPLAKYFTIRDGNGFRLSTFMYMQYQLHYKLRLNRPNLPCMSAEENARCMEQCIHDNIYNQSNVIMECRLPFMTSWEHRLKSLCTTSEQFEQVYEAVDRNVLVFNKDKCLCARKCKDVSYQLLYLGHDKLPGMKNRSRMLYLFNHDILVEEEFWSYRFDGLVADVGGSLGLFLGVSLLTIAEMVESCMCKIKKIKE